MMAQWMVERLRKAARWARGQHGGVAMIFAMSAPLLLAATGLTVDAGMWMQRQASLQSAADAAAVAVASAANKYSVTSANAASFASGSGQYFAVAAANNATQNQFGLASTGNAIVAVSVATSGSGTSTTLKWTATATIPRSQYLSAVRGLGLGGLAAGSQAASGTAATVQSSASVCGFFNGVMAVTGGAYIKATNCAIYNADSACPSTYVSGSGKIMASGGVLTPASCVATNGGAQTTSTTTGSGYIGTNTAGTTNNGDTSTATTNASTQSDPVAGMNSLNAALWNPGWTAPSAPAGMAGPYSPSIAYNTWSQPSSPQVGDCLALGANNGGCELYPNYLNSMTNLSAAQLILNLNTTSGTTYITGGMTGGIYYNTKISYGGITTINGNQLYINGGLGAGQYNTFASSTSFTINAGSATTSSVCGTTSINLCVVVNGGMSLGGGAISLGAGTYYLTGSGGGLPSTSVATSWGFAENATSIAIAGSTYYVNGGFGITNNSPTVTLASGLYEFQAYSGNTNASCTGTSSCGTQGAFYAGQGTDTFGTTPPSSGAPAPATYYFDGGLTISGGACNTVFNPGIYYIRNGNLIIDSCTSLNATGVTFVLEGSAGYTIAGGATVNISAPTTNCVDPASYPLSAYKNPASPYDGTNGEGICGIAIYQARGDTGADTIAGSGSMTINGSVYTPSAPLTISGAGALTIVTNDTSTTKLPAIEATSLTDSGSGNITLTENAASGGSGGGAVNTTTPVLVN